MTWPHRTFLADGFVSGRLLAFLADTAYFGSLLKTLAESIGKFTYVLGRIRFSSRSGVLPCARAVDNQ
jgi:hypothetical protein